MVSHDTSVSLISGAVEIEPTEQVSVENAVDQRVNCSSTPVKVTYSPAGSSYACESPLITHSSEAANLMVETPAQLPPKRASLETEEGLVVKSDKASTFSEKPAKRLLDFTFESADRYVLANAVEKTEHFMSLQHNITQAPKSKEYITYREVIMLGFLYNIVYSLSRVESSLTNYIFLCYIIHISTTLKLCLYHCFIGAARRWW